MSRFEHSEKGTGDGPFEISSLNQNKSKDRELRGGIGKSGPGPSPVPLLPSDADLASFLSRNPSLTTRDYKGKGFGPFAPFDPHHLGPGEKPWHRFTAREVRAFAITYPARFLSKGVRQAAARDQGLTWDEVTRRYRLVGEFNA